MDSETFLNFIAGFCIALFTVLPLYPLIMLGLSKYYRKCKENCGHVRIIYILLAIYLLTVSIFSTFINEKNAMALIIISLIILFTFIGTSIYLLK